MRGRAVNGARFRRLSETDGRICFHCPGCECLHAFNVNTAEGRPLWTWNGDLERATFAPSLLYRTEYGDGRPALVCHSFVRDGRIEFLNDCTHKLAGQTVDVPPID